MHAPRTRVGRDSLAHGQWPSAVHARRHEQAALQPLRRAPSSRHRPHSVHMQLLSRRSSSWPCAQSPTPSPPGAGRPAPRRASTHDALAARAATSTASEVRRRCNLLQARSARRPAAPTIRGESDGLLAPRPSPGRPRPARGPPAPPAAPGASSQTITSIGFCDKRHSINIRYRDHIISIYLCSSARCR